MNSAKSIIIIAAIVLCGVLVLPASSKDAYQEHAGGGMILTGDKDGLWLVGRSEDRKSYSVVFRETGGNWRWASQPRNGNPAAATAINNQLYVFLDSGRVRIFSMSGSLFGGKLGIEPLAVCPSYSLAESTDKNVIAVTSRPVLYPESTSRPTETPSTANSISERVVLSFMRNTSGDWKEFTTYDNVLLAEESRIMIANVGRSLFLLIVDASAGANRLAAWRDGKWREAPLQTELASQKILGLYSVENQLVVILAGKNDSSQWEIQFAIADETADKFAFQPVTADLTRANWADADLIMTATMPQQIALLWRDGEALKLAAVTLNGKMTPRRDVDIFSRNPGAADALIDMVMWGLMPAILILVFVLRPKSRTIPFMLPPEIRPGSLFKRVLAGMIDLLPFALITSQVFLHEQAAAAAKSGQDIQTTLKTLAEQYPLEVAYAALSCVGFYTLYSCLMELRFGATLGKMLFKLRVVANGGYKPTARQIILRNAVRAVPLIMQTLLPLLILFPMLNPNRQRLGDMIAHTPVAEAHRGAAGDTPPPPPDESTEETPDPPDE